MKIKTFVVGDLATNCYVLYNDKTKHALIVDPGDEPDKILDFLRSNQLNCSKIILTHCHPDHIMGAGHLKDELSAGVYMSDAELNFFNINVDHYLKEDEKIEALGISLGVLSTPGHSPGSISLVGDSFIITGDTLFCRGVGRTDLPGGSYDELNKSLKKIMKLSDNFKVYPGHGPATTILDEKKHNDFLKEI